MNYKKLFSLLSLSAFAFTTHATVIYVDQAASGANDGSSWTDGFTNLQTAISATLPGDSVWVAQGVYKPTTTTTRSISFILPNGVKIFGGFNGTETLLSQRNFTAYPSILSGDIGVTGNANDNSYHVVTTPSVSNATRLDGFKVISGNSNGGGTAGGLYNSGGSPVIANCIFEYNQATYGAALSQYNSGAMVLNNCTFRNNTAANYGGAIEVRAGTFQLSGCDFYSNTAVSDGGAMFIYDGLIKIDRCTFSGNTSGNSGGAISGYYYSTLTLTNSLIVGNTAAAFSAIYLPPSSNTNPHTVVNCTFADNAGAISGISSCVTLNSNTQISNSVFWGDSDPNEVPTYTGAVNYCLVEGGFTGSGANHIFTANPNFASPGNYLSAPFVASAYDYHVSTTSPATDAGNNSYLITIYNHDLDFNPRVHGPLVDLGAYENPYCTFNLSINASGPTSICPGSSVTLSASSGSNFSWSTSSSASSITVNSGGTYTLAADSSGCLGHDTIQVSVLPASVSISGVTHFCPGDSTLLTTTGSNLVAYTWNTSETTSSIYVNTTGTYSLTATTGDGCTATDAVMVTASPAANAVITLSNGVLSTTSFTSYQWLLNNVPISGATNNTFTPTQNGSYSVLVMNSTGCSDTSAAYVINDVGMNEYAGATFSLFPNPCSATLHLAFAVTFSGQVRISNVLGQEVMTLPLANETSMDINVAAWPAGVYFVKTENNSGLQSIRFVKE